MNEHSLPATESAGFCGNCGKSLTAETRHAIRGALYCEDCLALGLSRPHTDSAAANPTLAAILGFVPGLGAVYNGEYMKGLMHVVLFGLIIAGIDRSNAEEFFVPLLIAFIFYMPIEAFRTAKARSLGQKPASMFGKTVEGLPAGPIILIGVGMLLLLEKVIPRLLERIFDYWPIVLIVIGIAMLRKKMDGGLPSEESKNEQRN
jgi:hypothetical protein